MRPNEAQQLVGLHADNPDGTVAAACQESILIELKQGIDRLGMAGKPEALAVQTTGRGRSVM